MDRAAATNESHNTRCGSMSDIRHHVKTGHSKSRAEDLVFEILEIAADSSRDYVKKTGVDGKVTWVFDKEHFARQRLNIKALKWMLARMAPRKYGNR